MSVNTVIHHCCHAWPICPLNQIPSFLAFLLPSTATPLFDEVALNAGVAATASSTMTRKLCDSPEAAERSHSFQEHTHKHMAEALLSAYLSQFCLKDKATLFAILRQNPGKQGEKDTTMTGRAYFRGFEKGLADRGGWRKEIPPIP